MSKSSYFFLIQPSQPCATDKNTNNNYDENNNADFYSLIIHNKLDRPTSITNSEIQWNRGLTRDGGGIGMESALASCQSNWDTNAIAELMTSYPNSPLGVVTVTALLQSAYRALLLA